MSDVLIIDVTGGGCRVEGGCGGCRAGTKKIIIGCE